MPEQNNISSSTIGESELAGLVKDCIAGKRTAQRRFYETYAPAVYNTIKRYLYDDEAAQEILNDTFHKVFMRIHQFSWQGPIEAWMRRIAVNSVTDHIRKYIRHDKIIKQEINDDELYIEERAVTNISFKELVNVTYALPEMHRTVFNLYVFENMSHKEVGKCLAISEGNSRWILNDARKRLKQIITSTM